jgi:gamma-glutamylaminecyclotransferase
MHRVFICGSALRGQPDHQNLQGAVFVGEARTLPRYRLHAAGDGWHPAIYELSAAELAAAELAAGDAGAALGRSGISIPGEIYEMTPEQFDYLCANEPPHMYPTPVSLVDGGEATAFFYPRALTEEYGWPDISALGGWAAYQAVRSA